MSTPREPLPPRPRRRAAHGKASQPPVSVEPPRGPSPTHRLDAMTREHVKALEADRKRPRAEVRRLQERVDTLGPGNARLHEALGNAESNNVIATVLTVVGGFLVSYATFTGKAAPALADAAAGCLLAGIFLMLAQSVGRWRGA